VTTNLSLPQGEDAMSFTQQQSRRDHAFTVVGFYPSGEGFSDTIQATRADEAKIRVIAGQMYSEDGGDIEVSCVLDATGQVVDDAVLGAADILSETAALESLIEHLRFKIVGPAEVTDVRPDDVVQTNLLNAYLELFELVLSDAPYALELIEIGSTDYTEQDLTLRFSDSQGRDYEIVPAEALLALAQKSHELGWIPAASQIEELASKAGVPVSLAILEAVCS
jgi:hypothetical protein